MVTAYDICKQRCELLGVPYPEEREFYAQLYNVPQWMLCYFEAIYHRRYENEKVKP